MNVGASSSGDGVRWLLAYCLAALREGDHETAIKLVELALGQVGGMPGGDIVSASAEFADLGPQTEPKTSTEANVQLKGNDQSAESETFEWILSGQTWFLHHRSAGWKSSRTDETAPEWTFESVVCKLREWQKICGEVWFSATDLVKEMDIPSHPFARSPQAVAAEVRMVVKFLRSNNLVERPQHRIYKDKHNLLVSGDIAVDARRLGPEITQLSTTN